ncbi:MAG: transglutaminase domain-containing protein, partial [Candidatus Hodarchaeales archaeon]
MKTKIKDKILNHYLEFSPFTNPGCYREQLKKDLPNDIKKIGLLVRKQLIHRVTLRNGNKGSNVDLKYGDMNKVPWHRQPEDDYFPTASAILAELYRRDKRGFVKDRKEKNRLVVTCRFVSILTAS